ncbi:hypothetical protein [Streptomyces uncialis]|nr:hypothetical protein [Streptomyces uncialis]MCX4660822.1 hypothetical protein [Streptomyces uncialis]
MRRQSVFSSQVVTSVPQSVPSPARPNSRARSPYRAPSAASWPGSTAGPWPDDDAFLDPGGTDPPPGGLGAGDVGSGRVIASGLGAGGAIAGGAIGAEAPSPPMYGEVPPTSGVPQFPPLRVRGRFTAVRRVARQGRRAGAACLAAVVTGLLVADLTQRPTEPQRPAKQAGRVSAEDQHRPVAPWARAPVRIADVAAAGLLRPGDRVDIVTAGGPARNGAGRVVAAGVRVAEVPKAAAASLEGGALVVLSAPRRTAGRLAAAGAVSPLAVVLCR